MSYTILWSKANAVQNQQKVNDLMAEIEVLREEAEGFARKVREADEKRRDSITKASRFQRDVETLKSKRQQLQWHQGQVDKLSTDLKLRNESDEWLQGELDNYSGRMAVYAQHEQTQKEAYQGLQGNLESNTAHLKAKYSDEGIYKRDKTSHEQLVQTRSTMIREKASQHLFRGYDHDLEDEEIEDFMARISKVSRDQKSSIENERQDTDADLQRIRHSLDEIKERKLTFTEARKSSKERSLDNDRKIESFRIALGRLKFDEGAAALLESAITDLTTQLQRAKEKLKSVPYERQLQHSEIELRSLDERRRQLNKESMQMSTRAKESARLDFLRNQLLDNKKGLETMNGAHRERISKLVTQDWSPKDIQSQYEEVVQIREDDRNKTEASRGGLSTNLSQVESKLRTTRTDLKKAEKERQDCVRMIEEKAEVEPSGYLQALQDRQVDRDTLKGDVEKFDARQLFWEECLKTADKDRACRTCARAFQNEAEKSEFVNRMRRFLEKDHKDIVADLQGCEEDLQRAKDAFGSYTTWSRLTKSEIPRLREDVKTLDIERAALVDRLEDEDRNVANKQQSEADAKCLSGPIMKIHQYYEDIERLTLQCEELSGQQEDSGLSRSLDDIQQDMASVDAKSEEVRTVITKLKDEREAHRSRVSSLEVQLSQKKMELSQSTHDLEKKTDLERQIEELRRNNEAERDVVRRVSEQIKELEPLISEEEAKLADVQQRGLAKENRLREDADRLSKSVLELESASEQIREYIDGGGPGKLAACRREIERMEQESQRIQKEQTQITKELNKIRSELSTQKETRSNLKDNLTYRSSIRDLEKIENDIASLEATNAEADLEHHQRNVDHWGQQKTLLDKEYTRRNTSMTEKDVVLESYIQEFEQFYTNAAMDFKKSHIKVEVLIAFPVPIR